MKFLKEHQEVISLAILNCGYTKEEFSFIKRRGRIITQHGFSKSTFAYIQKEETTVDLDTKQWVDMTYFLYKINKEREEKEDTFEEVMVHFTMWLQTLN